MLSFVLRRRCFLAPALLIGIAIACSLGPLAAVPRQTLQVETTAVTLHPGNPGLRRVGALVWRGGLALDSGHAAFGGLSGLWIAPNGDRLLAVGDKGVWFAAALRHDARGDLAGLGAASIGSLRDVRGRAMTQRRSIDAEALTRAPGGDGFLVAFEGRHRIWRYPGAETTLAVPAESFPTPAELKAAPGNGGLEALTALADGRLFAVAEELRRGSARAGYVHQDGRWYPLAYPGEREYAPTDATQLPDGDLLVLERHFDYLTGVRVRLRRVPLEEVTPGGRITGKVIATIAPPLAVDNFEGIAARRTAAGETRVYLLSDDNFNIVQRTLLLMFVLAE